MIPYQIGDPVTIIYSYDSSSGLKEVWTLAFYNPYSVLQPWLATCGKRCTWIGRPEINFIHTEGEKS